MFKKMSTQIITISPEEAGEYLALNTYSAQRKIQAKHVNFLSNKMKCGEFRIGDIAVAHNNGSRILMNGQHQLSASMTSGVPFEALLETYNCPDAGDLSLLFRQFDNHAMRSLSQMVDAEVAALGLDWKKGVASLLVAALCNLSTDGKRFLSSASSMTKDERVRMIKYNIPEGNFINDIFIKSRMTNFMYRAGVFTAVILTYRVNQDDAYSFWVSVRDGENITKDMPEYKLRMFLLKNASRARRGAYLSASARELCHRSIIAWNAFRRSTTTTLRYYADAKGLPKVI